MDKYEQLKQLIFSMEDDFRKFYEKEQNAAGTRLRKALSELKKLSQDVRNDVQDIKTNRKDTK